MACIENLAEAKNALHALIMAEATGKQVIEVAYNGRSKKYNVSKNGVTNLKHYISDLERECGNGEGIKRGSIRFYG